MRKIFFLFLISTILSINIAIADETITQAVQYTNAANCYKSYAVPGEKLYFQTLTALAANKYTIKETQTKEGYILFVAHGREFLATVVNINDKTSLVKIAPVDNSYKFSPEIVQKVFASISQNLETEPIIYVKGK